MALIVNLNTALRPAGSSATGAIQQIRQAYGTLQSLDGLRAECIGVSAEEMAAKFGISNASEAQAFSDRWSALLAAWDSPSNTEFAKLRDFINAFASS